MKRRIPVFGGEVTKCLAVISCSAMLMVFASSVIGQDSGEGMLSTVLYLPGTGGVTHLETRYPGDFADRLDLFACTNLLGGGWTLLHTTNSNPAERMTEWEHASGEEADSGFYAVGSADFDEDADGIASLRETLLHRTDPLNPDSDGDEMPDGWEVRYGLSPINGDDAGHDSDLDGLDNLHEYILGRHPLAGARDDIHDELLLRIGTCAGCE